MAVLGYRIQSMRSVSPGRAAVAVAETLLRWMPLLFVPIVVGAQGPLLRLGAGLAPALGLLVLSTVGGLVAAALTYRVVQRWTR